MEKSPFGDFFVQGQSLILGKGAFSECKKRSFFLGKDFVEGRIFLDFFIEKRYLIDSCEYLRHRL